jgi:WD40 repeat protein/DNA-binding SARP family transcriptional activator
VRFRLLGPLEVTRDGLPIALGGPKQRLVLAHLLTRANQTVSADLLIDEVWRDQPPPAARSALQAYVSRLRRALGPDRLEGRAPGYVLHAAPEEIDAARFEELATRARRAMPTDLKAAGHLLRDALALWRGDPLVDLAGEQSLQPEISRLLELRLSAIEDHVEVDLALGRHRQQIAELERLVAGNPLRERLSAQLMLALYRSGRQAEALDSYQRLWRNLDAELGVDPSPEVERLQRQILMQDPGLDLRGEPLHGYRLLDTIGSGPHGVVHRAFEAQSERDLAIKVIAARIADEPDFIRAFDAAARRISRIENPHIARIVDWWREPHAAYIVMRLMPASSLAARLEADQLGEADALRWADQIGSALAAVHRQGLAHGNLHPRNVLLDDDGNAYLTDFAIGYDPARTGSSRAARHSSYLAPERAAGGPPSAAADIFAYGVLFGQLLRRSPLGAQVARNEALLGAVSPDPGARPSGALEIVTAVRRQALLPVASERGESDPTPPRNPYKGLRAFEEADAADFEGRQDLVRALVARMGERGAASRLLAVVGPSGSGKSSVVNAGLLPALRGGAVSNSSAWFVASMTPGRRPFEQLERALLSVAVGSPPAFGELLRDDRGWQPAADQVLPTDAELLLVIDQFEELFTRNPDARTREAFLDALAATIEDPRSRIRVVILLRADMYDRPLRHERLGRQVARRTHVVPPLTAEELERAIAEPAQRAGLRLESGLTGRIVAEMSEHPGALPLLQYVLAELWERRDGSHLSLAAYVASGGISGAVARRAEERFRRLEPGYRVAAKQVFLTLVEPGEGAPDTARTVHRSELRATGADQRSTDRVIDTFARYRLLLLDRDSETREPTLQLAHDALLSAWPRLQEWVDGARDDLRNQRRLAAAAAQWREAGRDPSFLLTGARLEQTNTWADVTTVPLSPAELEYLAASRQELTRLRAQDEARQAREGALERRSLFRLRALAMTLGIGVLLAGTLTLVAVGESQRAALTAREATARELAAAAVANLDVDPERSILLALHAVAATRGVDGSVMPEATEALHAAAVASRVVLTVPGLGGDAEWSPAGDVFVTEGPEGSGLIDIRDATTGESVRRWRGHDVDVNDVTFNQQGDMLATAGDDGAARVWDPASGTELAAISGRGLSIARSPSFSPDSQFVAAAWPDENVVRIRNLWTGELREFDSLLMPEHVAFSPDGAWLSVTAAPNLVVVLDVATGAEVTAIQLELPALRSAWSPDGAWLAASGLPIQIWSVADLNGGTTAQPEPRFAFGSSTGAVDLAWSADAGRLLTGSEDGRATLWGVTNRGVSEIAVLSSQDHGRLWGVALSPAGDRALTAEGLGGKERQPVAKVWDIGPTGDAEWLNLPADPGWAHVLDFTPDGRLLASSSGGTATMWDLPSAQPVLRIGPHGQTDAAPGPLMLHLDVSPDGALVATAGNDGSAVVWDAQTGNELFTISPSLQPGPQWVEEVAWSPDGRQLAVAANGVPPAGSQVLVVDRAGRVAAKLEESGMRPERVQFSPDGRLLAVAWIDTETWDLDAWHVTIWDTERGGAVRTIRTAARGLGFDPAGERLASVNDGGFAEIWDVGSGDLLATLAGHTGGLSRSISFSPDGTQVVTAGEDNSVRLWDAESGDVQLVLRGHKSVVARAVFSPDGSMLASTGADGVVRVWALDLDDLIGIAERKLTRDLTADECRQYLHAPSCPAR